MRSTLRCLVERYRFGGDVEAIGTSRAGILPYMTGGLFSPNRAVYAYIFGGTLGVIAGLVGWLLFDPIKARP